MSCACGHIPLMTDTCIANSSVDDLRAVVRALLVAGQSSAVEVFRKTVRQRLSEPYDLPPPSAIYVRPADSSSDPTCTPHFADLLSRARALFGAGLAIQSLPLLTYVIRNTSGLRWSDDGPFMDALAVVDGDIAQAIQASSEEASSGSSPDVKFHGRAALSALGQELRALEKEVEAWGGEFPFQRGLANVQWLESCASWSTAVKA